MEASDFGYWKPGPEREPTLREKIDAMLFPSSPEKQLRNMVIYATVSFAVILLVLAGKGAVHGG